MKKLMALLLTMVIITGVCTTSYAATSSYNPLSGYGYMGVPEINTDDIELPDAVKHTYRYLSNSCIVLKIYNIYI